MTKAVLVISFDREKRHNIVHFAPYCGRESLVTTIGQCVENFKFWLAVVPE
jgi:hypothetical protein